MRPGGADEIKEPGNMPQAEFAKRKVILHLTGLVRKEEKGMTKEEVIEANAHWTLMCA